MKRLFGKMDKTLFIMTILYLILGMVMIFSASSVAAVLRYKVSPYYFFIKQALFVSVTFIFSYIFILKFPTKKYTYLTKIMVVGILAALAGLFVYGTIINSAVSWYDLGFASIQPSEFAKTVIIIYFACYFSTTDITKQSNLLKPLFITGLIAILVILQPDLGGAVIISGIALMIFLSLPFAKTKLVKTLKIIIFFVAIFIAGFVFFGKQLLNENQLARLNFKNPCARYTENTGYQVCNGLIAISNGSLFGKGLGDSSQKYLYLPEAHTDFIFPIIVEELGSIVGTVLIIGYAFILYRILKIAKKSTTLRGSIIAYGVFSYISLHVLINLLGVFGLIPLTGIPLPFLSYGGSYNMNLIICIFLVQRVAIETKTTNEKRELNKIT